MRSLGDMLINSLEHPIVKRLNGEEEGDEEGGEEESARKGEDGASRTNALAQILAGKGFRHAWVIDSEYRQPWGERPTPHCIVAHCVITGETLRLWVGDDPSPPCPFALDRSELFIAYAADAEVGCFLAARLAGAAVHPRSLP